MPYIPVDRRRAMNVGHAPTTAGELNYAITKAVHSYLAAKGMNYANANEAIGVLECAKLELYRVVLATYENNKREESGAISELDAGFNESSTAKTLSAKPG